MTNDELRALADALEPMARAPRFENFDVPAFCAWVRACADAQPVAWRVECRWLDRRKGGDWRKYADYGTEQAARSSQQVFANPGDIESRIVPLYAHPAPAAPQAEPKREPLSEATALIEWPESAKWKNRAAPEGIERSCMGEPKREPLSDEQITKGEYVLATKFSDGDPGDHWGVGFYDRFENGRHYVVDRAGQQIRGSGFRRAGRITMEVGIWLLSAAKSLEASPPGTVNLWTMLTERAHGIGGSDAE